MKPYNSGAEHPIFEPGAIEALGLTANRIPRRIDRLAHHALIAAAAKGSASVSADHVALAAAESLL